MAVTFTDNSVQVTNAIEQAAIAWLHECSGEIVSQTARNTRVDKSQLKGSWDYKIDRGKLESVIGSPLENAIWEEFGTGEFAVNKNGRKGAWYVPVENYTGRKRPTYNGKVIVVYGKNKRKFYKTNGKRGTKAFTKAFDGLKAKIIQSAKDKFGGLST